MGGGNGIPDCTTNGVKSHFARGVLAIAQDVHMTTTGAYDRSTKEQAADIEYLELRLFTWQDTIGALAKEYDEAVRKLLYVVIEESQRAYGKRTTQK
jgi:hypothetical protein